MDTLQSQQTRRSVSALPFMSRNFYFQPGLPANASLWRTGALFLLLVGLGSALIGVMSHLFEQVDRRSEETRQAARRKRRGEKH